MFKLSSKPLDAESLRRAMEDDGAGALVVFEGRVRNSNEGKKVLKLEYEAYEQLALKAGAQILENAKVRFPIIEVVCIHRTGELQIGDLAVWVGVLSAHRAEAFDACRFTIDHIKAEVPIWKKEHYEDGTINWVNCAECASHAHAAKVTVDSSL